MIHFAYTVPRPSSLLWRGWNKLSGIVGIPPLHRTGNDALIPWKHPIRAPHSISYHLLRALKEIAPVRHYSLYEHVSPRLGSGDLFLGTPVPDGGFSYESRPSSDELASVTSAVLRDPKNRHAKRFLIMPYANDPLLVSWAKDLAQHHTDGIILIGGAIWTRDWERTAFGSIDQKKVCRVDMGIDMDDYPLVKKRFNPKGKRRYLYVGHTAWYKNTQELERIAAMLPGFEGGHIGTGTIKGWKKISDFADLTPEFMTRIAEEYDIFVSVSTADAQVTTVLEQMCFGLVVASTPESGYDHESLVSLRTHDTDHNVRTLQSLQDADEADLFSLVEKNREAVRTYHSWKRFTDTVLRFIGL